MALAHGSHASPSDINVCSAAVLARLTLGTVLSRILGIFENATDSAAGLPRLSFPIVFPICLNHSFSCLPLSPSCGCRAALCSLQPSAQVMGLVHPVVTGASRGTVCTSPLICGCNGKPSLGSSDRSPFVLRGVLWTGLWKGATDELSYPWSSFKLNQITKWSCSIKTLLKHLKLSLRTISGHLCLIWTLSKLEVHSGNLGNRFPHIYFYQVNCFHSYMSVYFC